MIKADLHIHTNFSYDGIDSPKEIVKSAIEKGVNCICITDHHEIRGAAEAMRYGFDRDILVVPGIEILSNSGDILGINVKKIIPDGLSAEQTVKEIRKQGGLAVIPHPFGKPFSSFWGGIRNILFVKPDALEIFNASAIFRSSNRKAINFSQKNSFCFTAGSDAHKKQFVGRGYIEILENVLSEDDLIRTIMERNVKIGGQSLSFFEVLKNVSNSSVKDIIRYYYRKKKNTRKLKKKLNTNCFPL